MQVARCKLTWTFPERLNSTFFYLFNMKAGNKCNKRERREGGGKHFQKFADIICEQSYTRKCSKLVQRIDALFKEISNSLFSSGLKGGDKGE